MSINTTPDIRKRIIEDMILIPGYYAESRLDKVKGNFKCVITEEDEALILEEFYYYYEICGNCGEIFNGEEDDETQEINCEHCGENPY